MPVIFVIKGQWFAQVIRKNLNLSGSISLSPIYATLNNCDFQDPSDIYITILQETDERLFHLPLLGASGFEAEGAPSSAMTVRV